MLSSLIITVLLQTSNAIAMEDPIREGCYKRHPQTTFSQNNATQELTPSEKAFLNGLIKFKENNFKESIEYFIMSSKYNNENAEYNLGVIYEYGVSNDFPKNLDEAERWYRAANKHGHIKAKKALERVLKEKENPSWFSFW